MLSVFQKNIIDIKPSIVAWTAGYKTRGKFAWCPKGEEFSPDLKVAGGGDENCVKMKILATGTGIAADDLMSANCSEKQFYACEVILYNL